MNKREDSWERLDTEFDHFLLDMKPYVLKHPNKTERQRCAVWIKKLCDPASCGSGLTGRKNRNLYARLLLHMLKRGVLEMPFTSKPEPGSLKTLPTYMSIYFDEPLSGRSLEHSNAGLPDWVTGELGGYTDDTLTLGLLKDRTSSTPIATHHRRRLYEEKTSSRPTASSPLKQSPRHDARRVDGGLKADMSPDDSDLEARLNSWNLGVENPRYLREKPIPLSPIFKSSFGRNSTLADDQGTVQSKEIEMKLKILESKHQEEKLKMQQRHDADVEKILDRKNGEIEEMKGMYRAKQKESEEMIRKLEKKAACCCLNMELRKFELQKKHAGGASGSSYAGDHSVGYRLDGQSVMPMQTYVDRASLRLRGNRLINVAWHGLHFTPSNSRSKYWWGTQFAAGVLSRLARYG
ncbi:centrosomal protein of 112 kDa-like protein, partial [Lates japonicus]